MGRHATALPDAIHTGRTLANGVRLAVTPLPHAPHAHVCVLLRGGPMHETDGTWGLSHLVEHMVFRGAGPMRGRHLTAIKAPGAVFFGLDKVVGLGRRPLSACECAREPNARHSCERDSM